MELDTLLLSRVQFGFTVGFHILFPTLTMGLALFLSVLEWRWLRTADTVYYQLYRFWLKIFALSFGMGVVSGVVLSYQFGTNFSAFSRFAGNVMGPLMGYEVLAAFFLEATFLGIMLFGINRVPAGMHFFATVMVALGTTLSAFFILAANSWMHTPAGHEIRDGVVVVTSWWSVIFSPSFPYRFVHMMLASYLTTALVIAGVSAWYLRRGLHGETARRGFGMAMLAVAVLAPAQILMGDLHGLQVQRDQPVKVAAMEGLWETRGAAPYVIFAIPDPREERNRFSLEIPYGASLLLKHHPRGEVLGLDQVPTQDRPHVPTVFYSFRIMVYLGFAFLLLGAAGLWARYRGSLYHSPWLHRGAVVLAPMGFVATLAGWMVTETGRQPWLVHGLMRTEDGVSPVPAQAVLTSLSLFVGVYGIVFTAYLVYVFKLIARGPSVYEPPETHDSTRTAWFLEWRRND